MDTGKGKALCMFEFKSVAGGILAMNAMVRDTGVDVLSSGPACPGKYLLIVGGGLSSVRASLDIGLSVAKGSVYDSAFLGNAHTELFTAIAGLGGRPEPGLAIGVVETFSAATALYSADAALKAAEVRMNDIRLSRGMGGRAFILFSGSVGACGAARDAAVDYAAHEGLLVGSMVMAAPHPDLVASL